MICPRCDSDQVKAMDEISRRRRLGGLHLRTLLFLMAFHGKGRGSGGFQAERGKAAGYAGHPSTSRLSTKT